MELKRLMEHNLYCACMFAKKLQKQGNSGGKANSIAGNYYGYNGSIVAYARQALKAMYKKDWGTYNKALDKAKQN